VNTDQYRISCPLGELTLITELTSMCLICLDSLWTNQLIHYIDLAGSWMTGRSFYSREVLLLSLLILRMISGTYLASHPMVTRCLSFQGINRRWRETPNIPVHLVLKAVHEDTPCSVACVQQTFRYRYNF
jgi:hypothetical protein